MPLAVGARSLNHWTTREVPLHNFNYWLNVIFSNTTSVWILSKLNIHINVPSKNLTLGSLKFHFTDVVLYQLQPYIPILLPTTTPP